MKIHRKSNETQVIGRCERVMIRHDIVGVRKEKVILIVHESKGIIGIAG